MSFLVQFHAHFIIAQGMNISVLQCLKENLKTFQLNFQFIQQSWLHSSSKERKQNRSLYCLSSTFISTKYAIVRFVCHGSEKIRPLVSIVFIYDCLVNWPFRSQICGVCLIWQNREQIQLHYV